MLFNLPSYITYDMRPENMRKALNAAFYAVLFQIAFTLVFIFVFGYSVNVYVYLELFAFLILGFLTKLDKPRASLLLLSLFILDRIYLSINLLSTLSTNYSTWTVLNAYYPIFMFFIGSIVLWKFYYHAFLFQKQSSSESRTLMKQHLNHSVQNLPKLYQVLKPKILLSLISVILLIALIAGWFYWFQWRPAQIRRKCFEKPESILKLTKSIDGMTVNQFNTVYRYCLVSQGMKAEDLLKSSE